MTYINNRFKLFLIYLYMLMGELGYLGQRRRVKKLKNGRFFSDSPNRFVGNHRQMHYNRYAEMRITVLVRDS